MAVTAGLSPIIQLVLAKLNEHYAFFAVYAEPYANAKPDIAETQGHCLSPSFPEANATFWLLRHMLWFAKLFSVMLGAAA